MGADLPATSAAAALKDSPAVQSLRSLMKEVEAIKAEREVMEAELKNAKSDMSKSIGLGIRGYFALQRLCSRPLSSPDLVCFCSVNNFQACSRW